MFPRTRSLSQHTCMLVSSRVFQRAPYTKSTANALPTTFFCSFTLFLTFPSNCLSLPCSTSFRTLPWTLQFVATVPAEPRKLKGTSVPSHVWFLPLTFQPLISFLFFEAASPFQILSSINQQFHYYFDSFTLHFLRVSPSS